MNLKLEYDQDFQQWIEHHLILFKEKRFDELDIEHLIEELKDMGKSNQYELNNRFTVLLAHLLKWQYQYKQLQDQWGTFTGGSWRGTITEQRLQITKLLRKNPSLKRYLADTLAEAYPDALKIALAETGLPQTTFPEVCPYTLEQVLDEIFYPDPF
jgi:hypothetical protein